MKPPFDFLIRSALISSVSLTGVLAAPASAQETATQQVQQSAQRGIVLNRPGAYVLPRGLTFPGSGDAILITASNVSLNLNGHRITGPGGKQGVGVRVLGASGVHVHNGHIDRFGVGVQVEGSNNVRIEGLQIRGEDAGGPPPGEVGVLVLNSRAVVIERNTVSRTFLGLFIRGGGSSGNRIANNTLTGGLNGQLGICYNPDGSGNPTGPSGDLVYNNLCSRWNVGIQTSTGTAGNIFRENALAYFQVAFQELGANQNILEGNSSIQINP